MSALVIGLAMLAPFAVALAAAKGADMLAARARRRRARRALEALGRAVRAGGAV